GWGGGLAGYGAEQGRYPKELEALAPAHLARVPQDLFSGKPLIYRPGETGYLLYSVGPNGKDEGGRGPEDEPSGDDLAVRMPPPEPRRKGPPRSRRPAVTLKNRGRMEGLGWRLASRRGPPGGG